MRRSILITSSLLVALFTAPIARADAPAVRAADAPARGGVRVDVELDPIAFALSGHSLHVGVGFDHFRFDIGAFAMELPEWAHGNDGFSASFDGFGIKVHAFLEDDGTGPFVGVAAGISDTLVARSGTHLAARDTNLSVGAEIGWLVPIVEGLYVKPWVGVGWVFGTEDVVLDGARYESQPLQIFPTVHLGYVF